MSSKDYKDIKDRKLRKVLERKERRDRRTEEKIMSAAEDIFSALGFVETRVRDIAERAEVNLALVNYYYKSKENLFGIIMRQKMQKLFGSVLPILMDETTTLEVKIDRISEEFSRVVSVEHNLPLFVFRELQNQDSQFIQIIPSEEIRGSSMLKQVAERRPDVDPLQYVMNILSLAFFPYLLAPVMTKAGFASEKEFAAIIRERRNLVPVWMKAMLAPEEEKTNE